MSAPDLDPALFESMNLSSSFYDECGVNFVKLCMLELPVLKRREGN